MGQKLIHAALCLLLSAAPVKAAEVYIGVTAGADGRPIWNIGLAPLSPGRPGSKEDTELAGRVRKVLRDDMLFSRHFNVIEEAPAADLSAEEAAEHWKKNGAGFVLEGEAGERGSTIALNLKLRDLASGELLLDRRYQQKGEVWRMVAHRAADDLVRQLTGKAGIAQSRIAFVNDQTGNKELYLMDYDGERLRKVTDNNSINILPKWSPDGKMLAFTSYRSGNPDLLLYDLAKGEIRALSERQGLNLPGGFDPNGSRMTATLSKGDEPKIHLIDLKTGDISPITNKWGVESSATFSPDSKQVAYVSNASGNPQVYVMELTTGRSTRLTKLNWCDSPAWSPTGEWVAFAGRAHPKDPFDIFLVDITGTRTVQLTHGEGSNEDPTWSPDGRFLLFSSTRGKAKRRQVYVMDADGSAPRLVGEIPGSSYTPSWGS